MPLKDSRRAPIMCLTLDGVGLTHAEQARRLCAAGARWVQFRMKSGEPDERLREALATVRICREHGATCIVNDSVELALASGADGAHLGATDGDWREARSRLGERYILGGTVNDAGAAARALQADCLDYAGVGPLRHTTTKKVLAPLLGIEGIRALATLLHPLPAWAIGGVSPEDLPALRAAGAAGVAVSSALFLEPDGIADAFRRYCAAWDGKSAA